MNEDGFIRDISESLYMSDLVDSKFDLHEILFFIDNILYFDHLCLYKYYINKIEKSEDYALKFLKWVAEFINSVTSKLYGCTIKYLYFNGQIDGKDISFVL